MDQKYTGARSAVEEELKGRPEIGKTKDPTDPWIHRSANMQCRTCMWFIAKSKSPTTPFTSTFLKMVGRCRRHAPSMSGFPAVFPTDWCGDHKIDENKI